MATQTLSPSEVRRQTLNALLVKYQEAVTKRDYYKDRADSMQLVLDLDQQKWSTTVLNWRGETMTRSDLQGYQATNASNYQTWANNAIAFKKDYEDYFDIVQTLEQADFVSANPNLAPQLAEIAANAQTEQTIGIAQAQATAASNALQAKGASEVATANAKRNNIIIIVVVVVVVVSVGLVLWKKFKKS